MKYVIVIRRKPYYYSRSARAEIIKYTRLVLWACGELTDCVHTYTYIYIESG